MGASPRSSAPSQVGAIVLVLALAALSCTRGPHVLPGGAALTPTRSALELTARPEFEGWMLGPDGPAGNDVRVGADGGRSFILRGTRWVDHRDGRTERGRQVFQEDDVKAIELPSRLGGGFLFYVTSGSGTLLWRAETWTSDLQPLGRVDPPVSEIIGGFDRLYLSSSSSYTLRAIDAVTGRPMDLSPLPEAAVYGDMVFADPWTAVVLASVRGALATFDAGESWHPLETPGQVSELGLLDSGAILIGTDRGRFALDAAGRLVETSARGNDALFSGADTFMRYGQEAFPEPAPLTPARPTTLGSRPLRAAVLRGWPDTASTAVVIEQGAVGRVRLNDGKVLSLEPFAGAQPCRGVALGLGFGFICAGARGPTEVYAYHGERLELELSLDGPHAVRSSGNGGLVIAAPCEAILRPSTPAPRRKPRGTLPDPSSQHYCVRQITGELLDVRVRGDVGAERVASLRDGRVVVLIPPRSNAPGRLSIVARNGTSTSELDLEPKTGPSARLARSGLWLDELWETDDGELGAWVVGARAFVGVRIDLRGKVHIGRLQEGVDESSFFGPYALHMAAAASLRETTDYGFEWRVSALPPAVLAAPGSVSPRRPLRGCSAVGCVYDDWLRIGFSGDRGVPEPARPPTPARVSFEAPGFAFWNLECAPAGGARGEPRPRSRAAAPRSMAAPRGSVDRRSSAPPESSPWLSFQGEAAPERRGSDVGYDFGETNESGAYRAYAWGPAAGEWARRGVWQVRVGDRFSSSAPWSTAVTRTAWADPAATAQAFGLDANTGVDWWLRLGATGQFGVLQLRVRSESSIHLLEQGRSITTLEPGIVSDLGIVAGAYAINERWYLGTSRAEEFQLYRVNQGKPELVASYPLLGRVVTQLISSVQGDELALWIKTSGSGWYVFPLDRESFAPQPPLHLPPERLGRVPSACEPGRPGWLAIAGVPLTETGVSESNTHLDFSAGAEGLHTKRLTARVVMDEGGVCVDALAALTDGQPPGELSVARQRAPRGALPLTVTDPGDERRWAFHCNTP